MQLTFIKTKSELAFIDHRINQTNVCIQIYRNKKIYANKKIQDNRIG